MNGKPRILDLFCGEGGCSAGYVRAGFEVIGVDIEAQPRYLDPARFRRGDALAVLVGLTTGRAPWGWGVDDYAAIHASPPCGAYSKAQRIQGNDHPALISATRDLLEQTGLPYAIENVMDAKPCLRDPVMLCGTMFELPLYRHRLFETNWPLDAPLHGEHFLKQTKMGRTPVDGEIMQPVGNFAGAERARKDLETPWMSRAGMAECVPPRYTEYVGARLLAHLESGREVAA